MLTPTNSRQTGPETINSVNLHKNELPTPINTKIFFDHLQDNLRSKFQFLKNWFTNGFHLQFEGPQTFRTCNNLRSALENIDVLKNKISKELDSGRCMGPFSYPPFPDLQVSPLGLVPKKEPNEFRVIHHLSFPAGTSINDGISHENSTVTYQSIDDAIKLIKKYGKGALLAKTDIESAFRLIPIHPNDYELLGFKIEDKYFYDRVLPMGCSISSRLFETFSTAIHWILEHKLQVAGVVHVLDDFLFVGPPNTEQCLKDLTEFLGFCSETAIPIKDSKTEYPTTCLTFLGIELDSVAMVARLPQDKVLKCGTTLTLYPSDVK
ncbi:uncharacterized protein [Argopecten irradians]|uniref:uncharacterized protein n=1 Tax=Argopecten irradians TaxID=31199 RepID=UPI00371513E0